MNEELYSRLNELPSERLLVILAFFMNQYTIEAQAILRRLGSERGLTDDDVHRFRQLALLPKSAQYECQSCRELLDLDLSDLRDGVFTCPICRMMQLINYRLIPGCAENLDYTEEDERSLSSILSEFEEESADHAAPVGVGGWLRLFEFLLIAGLVAFFAYVPLALRDSDYAGLLLTLGALVACIVLLYLLRRESRLFPPVCSIFLIAGSIAVAVGGADDPIWPYHFVRTALAFAVALTGIGYLLRSRRVRATFGRPQFPGPAQVPPSPPGADSDRDLIA